MKIVHMNEELLSLSADKFDSKRDNSEKIRLMKKYILAVIENELNERQKRCLELRFYKNYSAKEIARELGIDVSVVYKHIKKGLLRIKKSSVYFNFR